MKFHVWNWISHFNSHLNIFLCRILFESIYLYVLTVHCFYNIYNISLIFFINISNVPFRIHTFLWMNIFLVNSLHISSDCTSILHWSAPEADSPSKMDALKKIDQENTANFIHILCSFPSPHRFDGSYRKIEYEELK